MFRKPWGVDLRTLLLPPRTRAALPLVLLACLTLLAAPRLAGAAEPFAALTVTPHGRQLYDITTGVTTMPDGGTVTDTSTGVALVAENVVYLAGRYIEAARAMVDGEFGRVIAAELHVDLESGVLKANGDLSLERDGLRITAATLHYDANSQIAVFAGGVQANDPEFQADRLLLDVVSGDVLLDGRYVYQGALFTMASPEGGGRLELRFVLKDGEPSYDAATQVRPELLRRFASFL